MSDYEEMKELNKKIIREHKTLVELFKKVLKNKDMDRKGKRECKRFMRNSEKNIEDSKKKLVQLKELKILGIFDEEGKAKI